MSETPQMLRDKDIPETENGSPPLVRADGVRKWFGHLEVLKGISLSVRKGEVLSIAGRS